MKIIRGILSFLLGIVLSITIYVFALNVIVEQVFYEDMLKSMVTQAFVQGVVESSDITDNNVIDTDVILNNEELKESTGALLDEFVNLVEGTGNITPETIDNLFSVLLDNKDLLEEITGEEIDPSELKEFMDSEEYQDIRNQIVEEANNIDINPEFEGYNYITMYKQFISKEFRLILIGIMLVNILLYSLINFSLYKFLGYVGKCLITNSILVAILGLGGQFIINAILEEAEFDFAINCTSIYIIAGVLLVSGIVLSIICKVINNYLFDKSTSNIEDTNTVPVVRAE